MLNIARFEYTKWKQGKISASIAWKNITGKEYSEETARKYLNGLDDLLEIKYPEITGVFGDTHIKFDHPNYLKFVKDTFESYGVSRIVCTGDLVDNHAVSRHLSSPDAMGAKDEYYQTLARVEEYTKAFPNVKMCRGNHDDIPVRQAATLGIPREFVKDLHETWNLPKTWEVREQFVIDDVVYKHGISCGGKDGAFNTALVERMSTVIGHSHAYAGCKYAANSRSLIFGLNVGSGIDVDAYAFEYGKYSKYKPILGCGIVFNKTFAIFVPMSSKFFRS
jgi:predicted phosphodiesterase